MNHMFLINLFRIRDLIVIAVTFLVFTGCVKQEFDKPPIQQIPIGTVININDVRTIFSDSGNYSFKGDYSLYAVVTMDESSGNIYKSAYIQDQSGAINLHLLETGGLKVGDSIRVYLKNCSLSLYSDLLQIDNVQNDSNIVILANGKYLTPQLVNLSDINTGNLESFLVAINDVQFQQSELGKTYADIDAPANRMLEDCDGNSIIVRSSNYANFATSVLPEGKGNLTAVVGIYNGTKQLYIKTTNEVHLNGERCEGGGPGPTPVDEINETFDDVGADQDINIEGWSNLIEAGDRKWQGKVYTGNTYAQATAYNSGLDQMISWLITPPIRVEGAKTLNFKSAKAYWAHQQDDGLTVWASTNFNGSNLQSATWTQLTARIANQNDNDHDFIESGDVDLSGFAGICYVAFKYRGSDTESTSFRIDDVVVSNNGTGNGVTSINEDFESQSNDVDINISGWLNIATVGSRLWRGKEFSGNLYAQATSYNSNEDNESWLITPAMDLEAMNNPRFIFESAQAYWVHDGLTVLISTDFNGGSIQNATWNSLSAAIAGENDPEHEWISSGIIDLSGFSGKAYIAFKYTGSGISGQTTSYRIDNVILYDE